MKVFNKIIMIIITAAIFLASSSFHPSNMAVVAAKEASSAGTAAATKMWFQLDVHDLGGELGYINGVMEKASECLPSGYLLTYFQSYENDDKVVIPRIYYKNRGDSEVRKIFCSKYLFKETKWQAGRWIGCSMALQAETQANMEFQEGLSEKMINDHLPMTAAIKKNKPKATTTTSTNTSNNKWWINIGGDMSVYAKNPSDTVLYLKDNISGVVKPTNCKSYNKPRDDDAVDHFDKCSILEDIKYFNHKGAIVSNFKKALKDIEEQCAYPISLQTAKINPIDYDSIKEQLDTIQKSVEEIGFEIEGWSFHKKKNAFYKALFGSGGDDFFTCPAYDNKTVCSPNVRARIVLIKALMEEILHFFDEIGIMKIAAGPSAAVAVA